MTPFVEAARQLVRGLVWEGSHLPEVSHAGRRLVWRHHGLGMLQAEFTDALRIHIWHPRLVDPAMAWPRCVHDHRFIIDSAVVIGNVIDVPCDVIEVGAVTCTKCSARLNGPPPGIGCPGPHSWVESVLREGDGREAVNVYEIEHAKNQDRMVDSKSGCSTATSAKLLFRGGLLQRHEQIQAEGSEYRLWRRSFHTTRVQALAITVIHRWDFDDKLARVLCAPDSDVTAVSGIVRDDSLAHKSLVNWVLREAADAIAQAEALGDGAFL